MTCRFRKAAALAIALTALQGGVVRAQYGYPVGYGGYGWGGWGGGGGGETLPGSIARGMGAYAAGAGYYNQQTAVANSINADTVTRWNQYWYNSQLEANRAERERRARRQYGTSKARDQIYKRLRDNPEPADIYRGDALNVALEQVNDPRIYTKTLEGARLKVGGDAIRNIPFQHAAAAVTTSFHQIATGTPPPVLMTEAYAADRAALKALGTEIRADLDKGETPNPATTDKALGLINKLEAKVDNNLPRNSRQRVEADKYLKSLHGLLVMLQTPAIDVLLSGVEKRPDATLGELLQFMNAFNLRFGPATTPRQREVYDTLWRMLDKLRDETAPALADTGAPKASGTEPGEFFSGMRYEDLQKKAPAPPAPGTRPR